MQCRVIREGGPDILRWLVPIVRYWGVSCAAASLKVLFSMCSWWLACVKQVRGWKLSCGSGLSSSLHFSAVVYFCNMQVWGLYLSFGGSGGNCGIGWDSRDWSWVVLGGWRKLVGQCVGVAIIASALSWLVLAVVASISTSMAYVWWFLVEHVAVSGRQLCEIWNS